MGARSTAPKLAVFLFNGNVLHYANTNSSAISLKASGVEVYSVGKSFIATRVFEGGFSSLVVCTSDWHADGGGSIPIGYHVQHSTSLLGGMRKR